MHLEAPIVALFGRISPVADAVCAHCTLPMPAGDVVPASRLQFCCAGCAAVFSAIHAHGLEQYYQFRADTTAARPPATSHRDYLEFDDVAFRDRHVRQLADGLRQVELYLEGVHCTACVWIVERLPTVVAGVIGSRLDLHRQAVEIVWNPQETTLANVARQLDHFGYPAHPYRGAATRALRRQEERKLLMRIGLAWAVSGNVMVMSLALYAGWFDDMDAATAQLFRWVALVVTLPSITWAAWPFFHGAFSGLRQRILAMDLPVAIGLSAGFLGGSWNVIRGQGEIYFDSVASLIFLLLVGRWVQLRQRRQASDAAELLFSLAPSTAHRVDASGTVRDVAIECVQTGDLVDVRAGETFPVDGTLTVGHTTVDTAMLTGESRPVEIAVGERIYAGTTNLAAQVRVMTQLTGEDSRVGQLMHAIAEAARRRAPIVVMANALVGKFVGLILAAAAITALLWAFLDPAQALDNTIALLIVTCPCALGLATPLAVHAALGRAARLGILLKGGDVVERLAKPGLVLFDKTGTLTQGHLQLLATAGDSSVWPAILALEQQCSHPLARAVVRAWPQLTAPPALNVEQALGGGVSGCVAGTAVRVGSPEFACAFIDQDSAEPADFGVADQVERWAAQGITPVLAVVDGQVRAALGFGDPVRPEAAAAVAALRAAGCQVGILSGDHPRVVAAVASQLGLDPALCRGRCSPEDKLAVVQSEKLRGDVVMVGDGVNDAAALAAATVGISVNGGAVASLVAADVFLTTPGLQPVVELLAGSKRTVAVIRRTIAFSLAYNLIGVVLAASGLLNPLIAAILMPLSSLTVMSLSFRSKTFVRSEG